MDGCNGLQRLELEHEAVFDKEIEPRLADDLALVFHADRHLASKADTAERPFDAERFFIDRFQKPGPEKPVQLDRSPDHTVSKVAQLRAWLHLPKILGDLGVLAVHTLLSTRPRAMLFTTRSIIFGRRLTCGSGTRRRGAKSCSWRSPHPPVPRDG